MTTFGNPTEINRVYTDEFISIYLVSNKSKTKVYSVWTKDLMCKIGGISWYPAWRHYCFFPNAAEEDLVFSDRCLLNIGNQVLALNKLHTKKLNREKLFAKKIKPTTQKPIVRRTHKTKHE